MQTNLGAGMGTIDSKDVLCTNEWPRAKRAVNIDKVSGAYFRVPKWLGILVCHST